MLRVTFRAQPDTHEFFSHRVSPEFKTFHIYPGQHITAQLRSSFHGPIESEIHCGDLIWQVLGDQLAMEYKKWLWEHKVCAAIWRFWVCWAVRENDQGFSAARCTARDHWAAAQLLSPSYVAQWSIHGIHGGEKKSIKGLGVLKIMLRTSEPAHFDMIGQLHI